MKKNIIGLVLVIALAISVAGCASTERQFKDTYSNLSGGLNRTVNIYSLDGKKIASYNGKIDVDIADSGRVKFDLNGKRYIYANAIIEVVEE